MMVDGVDFTGTISMSVSGDASFGWGVIMIVLFGGCPFYGCCSVEALQQSKFARLGFISSSL